MQSENSIQSCFPNFFSTLTKKVEIQKGNLRFRSGYDRYLSRIVPFHFRQKSDQVSSIILEKLKKFHFKKYPENRIKKGCILANLAESSLKLSPSLKIDKEIRLYAQALRLRNPENLIKDNPVDFSEPLADLGVNALSQALHPDFVEFVEANLLTDYMPGAGLHFKMTGNHEPMIPLNGKMTPWSDARREIFGGKLIKEMILPIDWRFDSEGITHKSVSKWVHLEPCGKEANHDGKSYVEVMSTKDGLNHCWIRIIDSKGRVYSAGLCGIIRSFGFCRGDKGKINSPDHREFLPNKRITRILIIEDEFKKLKNKIETDQNTKNLYFNLLTRNCSAWVCEVLKEININVDNREFPSQILLRKVFHKLKVNPPEKLLKVIGAIALIARMILGTILAVLGGAWYEDSKVEKLEKKYGRKWKTKPKKPFRSILSFFNGTNCIMSSSFKLAAWQEHIEASRKVHLEEIQKNKKEILEEFFKYERFKKIRRKDAWKELKNKIAFSKPTDEGHLYISKDLPIHKQHPSYYVNVLVESFEGH